VVTGEKDSPTAACAGRKRQLKWVPRAWGYSWATLPGGYKYGGLALQVAGTSSGRQPITVKKMLGKLNCGFRKVSLSGIELGWKRINEMRIATWNVHILYRAEAMNEMVKDVEV